jgi:hypothetical protein
LIIAWLAAWALEISLFAVLLAALMKAFVVLFSALSPPPPGAPSTQAPSFLEYLRLPNLQFVLLTGLCLLAAFLGADRLAQRRGRYLIWFAAAGALAMLLHLAVEQLLGWALAGPQYHFYQDVIVSAAVMGIALGLISGLVAGWIARPTAPPRSRPMGN